MEFHTLEELLDRLPAERRRAIEQGARKSVRRQQTRNDPAVRDLLIRERMQSPASGYYLDQPKDDIGLAWYFWNVRNDPELFAAECFSTPPRLLVHVLFLLRKILRHPDWKPAQQYRPPEEHFARRLEHLKKEMDWLNHPRMRIRKGYIADLHRNARRFTGLVH